MLPDI